jgi:hypothetical protein
VQHCQPGNQARKLTVCHWLHCPFALLSGTGWAAADALLMRTFPILSGAWTPQFDVRHVISALQANVFIVSAGCAADW